MFTSNSRQISHTNIPQRRSEWQDHRSEIDDQVPAQEGIMFGCRGWERGDDRGRIDLEHHVGYQLLSQSAEERMAERGQLDDQGEHEPA